MSWTYKKPNEPCFEFRYEDGTIRYTTLINVRIRGIKWKKKRPIFFAQHGTNISKKYYNNDILPHLKLGIKYEP